MSFTNAAVHTATNDALMRKNKDLRDQIALCQKQVQRYRDGWMSRGRKMNGTGEFTDLGPMHDHETVVNLRQALALTLAERNALADALGVVLYLDGYESAAATRYVQEIIENAMLPKDNDDAAV